MRNPVAGIRYVAAIAVAGFAALGVVTSVLGVAKTVELIRHLLDGEWRKSAPLVELLQVVDVFLLAVVMLVVALGIYELFIGRLDLPGWLVVTSFEDLKKAIVDVLVVFVAIRGIEEIYSGQTASDRLMAAGAVAVLIIALTAFRWKPIGGTKSR
ncbi:MAG: YqhA family protein [Actinomycetota bacterium]